MRKTRLMEVAQSFGDRNGATLNSATIDSVVYLMCEFSEGKFGRNIIDKIGTSICLSNGGRNVKKTLEFLAAEFFEKSVKEALRSENLPGREKISILPPLSEASYIDYFTTLNGFDRNYMRSPNARAYELLNSILFAYQTTNSETLCGQIVEFHYLTKTPEGLVSLIRDLAVYAKNQTT
jgi:hypothetical protein